MLVTPVRQIKLGKERSKLWWVSYPEAVGSLFKINGVWQVISYPTQDQVESAEVAFIGGHEQYVTDTQATEIIAAGLGAWITTDDTFTDAFTDDFS
jgi:hypothetical protein